VSDLRKARTAEAVGTGAVNYDPLSVAWIKGYYCAVATLIRMDGIVGTAAKELWRDGTTPEQVAAFAEPSDVDTFRFHLLLPCHCGSQLPHDYDAVTCAALDNP